MPLQRNKTPVPAGFKFSAVSADIKYKNRNDLALIYTERPATVSGAFTTNLVKAAPVVVTKRHLRTATARAILINSGNANACTGQRGINDALYLIKNLSKELGIANQDVLVSSTGVIGTPLPVERMKAKIPELINGLDTGSIEDVAEAIMTTDTFPKLTHTHFRKGKKLYTITGVAKGAGMIAPNMATMLSFVVTDLPVAGRALKLAVKEAVAETFNCITVDGDMSTNDMVIVMANGAAGGTVLDEQSRYFKNFKRSLTELMDTLARMIASDGEGATKLIIIRIKGAKSKSDARKAALTIANSPLVKTAIYGHDANWGRIMAALGRSGTRIKEGLISIRINNIEIVKNGIATGRDPEAGQSIKNSTEVFIDINLSSGPHHIRVYTCDLTEEYIRINAEYRT
ncbi:MAG: bifunctional glutamate N-acetyltransferase/amino-acid acetyltransferase ArgJ [Nitrospirae bacterium]|nr:bifunctional glutamate N-acetyltransferase/amino-acid acetyltransferase ArgJ [Nitrospirota bacterium]